MAEYKKKFITFLLLIIALISMLSVQSVASESAKEMFDNSDSLFASDCNFSGKSSSHISNRQLFIKMMFSIFLIVILGAAAIYISKKLGKRITNLPGRRIRIIETAHIGQRKSIHLIKVDDKELLISSTNENITKLADITNLKTFNINE
ncbi:MAG: flagellar biosynthetic protein FliO [Planctomycetes bacterium]|nr:flagellar biosynthetic protein FliO [Planctomycetota bacterium]MCK5473525.1 flagellar biosynthetic protein FliO [Planctomycetota bacterium]